MKQAIINLAAAVKELAAAIKEGKEENSPTPPIRRKPKKPTTTTTRARAREGLPPHFTKSEKKSKIFWRKNAEILTWIIEGHAAR